MARINATSPELLRAFAKLNAGKAYAAQVKSFNFLSFASGAQPPADQNPAQFRLVAPYGTVGERRRALWVNVREPEDTRRLHTDRTRPGTAIADSHRLHALRYFSHPESKCADQDGNPCRRQTKALLLRRHVNASVIAHIGKEANQLDQCETGQLTGDAAADILLACSDPSVDTWRNEDVPRLRQFPSRQWQRLQASAKADSETSTPDAPPHVRPRRNAYAMFSPIRYRERSPSVRNPVSCSSYVAISSQWLGRAFTPRY
jgi:hypothetical protein